MPQWKRWLIVKANGSCRVTTRDPYLNWDEVAFRLTIRFPDLWRSVAGNVEVTIPDAAAEIAVTGMELAQTEPATATADEREGS